MIYDENGFVKIHKPSKQEIKKQARKFNRRMFWKTEFNSLMMVITMILWWLAVVCFIIIIIIYAIR